MGKSVISAVNLISESIESETTESLHLIKSLEEELDEQQIELNSSCEDVFKTNSLSKKQIKTVNNLFYCGIYLERIGDLCANISFSLKKIISFKEDVIELNAVIALATKINNLIDMAVMSVIEEDMGLASKVLMVTDDFDQFKDNVYQKTILQMQDNNGYVPLCMPVIFICRNLLRIGELSKDLADCTVAITKDKDRRFKEVYDVL